MVRKSILSRMRSKKKVDSSETNSLQRAPVGSSRKDRVSASASGFPLDASDHRDIEPGPTTRPGKGFADFGAIKDRGAALESAFDELEPVDPKKFRELLKLERETPLQAIPERRSAVGPAPIVPVTNPRPTAGVMGEREPIEPNDGLPEFDESTSLESLSSNQGQGAGVPVKRRFMPSPGQSREEVLTKIREGFTGLNNVLSDIGSKLEAHNDRSDELVRSVHTIPQLMKDLPENSRNGVQLLNTISGALETQTSVTREMVDRIGALAEQVRRLPEALEHVSAKLDRQDIATRRIDQSVTHVKEAVVAMQVESARIHRETLDEFRRSQDADREQVQSTLEKDRDMLRAMMDRTSRQGQFMMVLTVVLILAFLAALSKL